MSVEMSDSATGLASVPPFEKWLGAWETSADSVYCRSLQGRILAANLSFARKFGRPAVALTETRVADLIHPDDLPALQASEATLAQPPHRAVAEHRWLTPQGARWFSWDETALRNPAGEIVAIRAVGRDITRQRLAEEQYYRLSRAVEQSPVAILITDLDGRTQYVNPKFTESSGRTLEDLLEHKTEVLRDGHLDEASYQNFLATVRGGGEWRGELSTQRKDGSIRTESVKVSCLRGPTGEVNNLLCLREDVTERKKLEHELRQAHKMESLGTLAGGIAHDFNNLLAIINGYSEFCQQSGVSPAALQKGLREIHRAAQRAGGLVRQILTFSRKNEVKFAAVDLNQLVRDLVTMLAETFPRVITFNPVLQDGLPPLLADQNQLQQIILNLCVNARDAMPDGGVITLTTAVCTGESLRDRGGDPARAYACLQVSDTGTGMTPEVRQRIFEPFFTTKQGNCGTGLGLAVVYGIVVSHHGIIDVESKPGAGSTFSVHLPLALGATVTPVFLPQREFPGGTESILLVDDEPSLLMLLETTFTGKGYRTSTASTGLEAIEWLSDPSRAFDAVVLDLNMPGASGIEVLKVIRFCRPTLKVLVVSGHLTAEARSAFDALGHRHFLQKPYKLDEIGRCLRTLLDADKAA